MEGNIKKRDPGQPATQRIFHKQLRTTGLQEIKKDQKGCAILNMDKVMRNDRSENSRLSHDHNMQVEIFWLWEAIQEFIFLDFPGGPVVGTWPSNARGVGLIPGQGSKIPHALGPRDQKTEHRQCQSRFNKDFRNGTHTRTHTHTHTEELIPLDHRQ